MKRASGLILCALAGCAGVPRYVSKPATIFPHMMALGEPRDALPVGALWVEGFGPVGDGATPDNLEIVRSLSAVTVDRTLQLNLTAGLLDFLGLDPRYRSRVQARFGDISMVRVKDMAKLSGPPGKARIYAALKAQSITITSDREAGLAVEARAQSLALPAKGQTTSNNARVIMIDARDMFFAFRVAQLIETQSVPVRATLDDAGRTKANFGKAVLAVKFERGNQGECRVNMGNSHDVIPPAAPTPLSIAPTSQGLELPLDQPIYDGDGGLYDTLEITWEDPARVCVPAASAIMHLSGTRLLPFAKVQPRSW